MSNNQKPRFKADRIVAFSAILISLCALIVSFYEVRIMRSQQKASLYPHLQISEQYGPDGFAIEAKNKGIGPAKIESLRVLVEGVPQVNLPDVFDKLLGLNHSINWNIYTVNTINYLVLEPSYDKPLFRVEWNEDSRELIKHLNDFEIEVIYSSLLGDCWKVNFRETPEECDCPTDIDEDEQFIF